MDIRKKCTVFEISLTRFSLLGYKLKGTQPWYRNIAQRAVVRNLLECEISNSMISSA